MSNVFVIIKMCYVYNQWYDISCATLYYVKGYTLKNSGLSLGRNGFGPLRFFSGPFKTGRAKTSLY